MSDKFSNLPELRLRIASRRPQRLLFGLALAVLALSWLELYRRGYGSWLVLAPVQLCLLLQSLRFSENYEYLACSAGAWRLGLNTGERPVSLVSAPVAIPGVIYLPVRDDSTGALHRLWLFSIALPAADARRLRLYLRLFPGNRVQSLDRGELPGVSTVSRASGNRPG